MTSRMSIGSPICTQSASCMDQDNSVYELSIFIFYYNKQLIYSSIQSNKNWFIIWHILWIFTIGKPLANRPRPTTHTTGTITMGLNNLIKQEKEILTNNHSNKLKLLLYMPIFKRNRESKLILKIEDWHNKIYLVKFPHVLLYPRKILMKEETIRDPWIVLIV